MKEDPCRLCLRDGGRTISIFEDGPLSSQIQCEIVDCCPIEVLRGDRLPQVICVECRAKLRAAYEFRKQCYESDRKLREHERRWPTEPRVKAFEDARVQPVVTRTWATEGERLAVPVLGEIVEVGGSETDLEKESLRRRAGGIDENATGSSERNGLPMGDGGLASLTWGLAPSGPRVKSSLVDSRQKGRKKRGGRVPRVKAKLKTKERERERASARAQEGAPWVSAGSADEREAPEGKDDRRYLCDVCSKRFASKSGLRFHLKMHDGSKPYVCQYCDKRFAIPSYKKRHERIHTGGKRLVCHVCSAGFASSNGLKYHLRAHSGEANYHCQTCGKSFGRYKYLKEHTFTHTGERPFVCKICGSTYGNSGSLFVHERKCKNRQPPAVSSLGTRATA